MNIKYLLIISLVLIILSGCNLSDDVIAEQPDSIYDGCDPSGDMVCLNGVAAARVTAAGQVVGLINESSGFVHHKNYKKSNLWKNGEISGYSVRFQGRDCIGDPYHRYAGIDPYQLLLPTLQGELFEWEGSLYYYPPGTDTFYEFEAQSYYRYNPSTGRICSNTTTGTYLHIKLLPNHPQKTGVQTYPFPTPIEIVRGRPVTIITP